MPAIDLYYSIATSRLDAQMQQIDQLHSKVAGAYTSATAILAVFAGLLSLAKVPADGWGRIIVLGSFGLAGVIYVLLAIFLCAAYRVSNWSSRPDLDDLQERAKKFDDNSMRVWVANECLRSYKANKRRIATKSRWLFFGLAALTMEVVLLAIAGGATLLTR